MNNSDNVELPDRYTRATSQRKDINMFRSMGLDVDDDNDLALENILEQQPLLSIQSALTTSIKSGLKVG